MHLTKDGVALITSPYTIQATGTTVPAFNLTSLLDRSSKVMLNYQIDDCGMVEERACGCPLHAFGYTTQLCAVRSYAKLVGESVTLIGSDLLRILEDVLPARFGGSSLDYQLQEAEDAGGLTRLYLVISPRVAIPDERRVIEVVLGGLRESSSMGDAARSVWQQAGTLQVKRAEPVWTSRGKMSPLHVQRGTHES